MDLLKDSVKNSRERVIELLDERTRMEKEIYYLWQDKRRLTQEVTIKDAWIDELVSELGKVQAQYNSV